MTLSEIIQAIPAIVEDVLTDLAAVLECPGGLDALEPPAPDEGAALGE